MLVKSLLSCVKYPQSLFNVNIELVSFVAVGELAEVFKLGRTSLKKRIIAQGIMRYFGETKNIRKTY